jgi:5-methylcytosine-specific restriction enzyme subunit McrC
MGIPIENIYYLLCYAWDKLDEGDKTQISLNDTTELVDLFAKILINSTKLLLKRGFDKYYVNKTQELAGVKGKIEFSQTLKCGLHHKQRTLCTFDDYSANILHNQILLSTINRLIRTNEVNRELKNELKKLTWMFPNIDLIELKSDLFKKVQLNRNNRFYGFIMNVCKIIYESTLPAEQRGNYTFSDFTRDERKMNQLFEAFIRNFYKIEQKQFNIVKKETIHWQLECNDIISFNYLPSMETDITLENHFQKIIIDAKYYKETMVTYYDKERINSSNLYQLFSYLLNQENKELISTNATGILVYPTITNEYNLSYKYNNHKIFVKTVNLNTNWKNIENRLKEIIAI